MSERKVPRIIDHDAELAAVKANNHIKGGRGSSLRPPPTETEITYAASYGWIWNPETMSYDFAHADISDPDPILAPVGYNNGMGPNMVHMQGDVEAPPQRALHNLDVIDRAVHNSPPPLDDVGGIETELFDEQDPHRPEPPDWEPLPIYDDGTAKLLADRQRTHGDFRDNGRVMQALKDIARSGPHWVKLNPHQREAIDMILHKIGRVVCGDPNHPDHWDDIAGYAKRVLTFFV